MLPILHGTVKLVKIKHYKISINITALSVPSD